MPTISPTPDNAYDDRPLSDLTEILRDEFVGLTRIEVSAATRATMAIVRTVRRRA